MRLYTSVYVAELKTAINIKSVITVIQLCKCKTISMMRSHTSHFIFSYILMLSCFCVGMSTVWRWSIRPPVTRPRTLLGSLPQILRLVNAGATTASSGWTFWPARATWTCRLTHWSYGKLAHRHHHHPDVPEHAPLHHSDIINTSSTSKQVCCCRVTECFWSSCVCCPATRFAHPRSSRSAEISTGTSASWNRPRVAIYSRSTTSKRYSLCVFVFVRAFHIFRLTSA